MKTTPEILKTNMDLMRQDKELLPVKNSDGTLTTFCNFNAYRICNALGLKLFWNQNASRCMTANEMYAFMAIHPEMFSHFKDNNLAFSLANQGWLIFAAQPEEAHGHIAPIYPSAGMVTSGKWNTQVPECSNIGISNQVFGINFAFADPPDFFVVTVNP